MVNLNYYFLSFFFMLISSVFFFLIFLILLMEDMVVMVEWNFLILNSISVCYLFYFDWISCTFISVVLFISSMVILYSSDYMGSFGYLSIRFLMLVNLFVISMIMMIISPNLLSILLGWDGLGLVSYCLVIYYMSMSSYLAGMITCLMNRLGDIGLLVCISWMFCYGSWMFMFYSGLYSNLIFFILIISSFTKSAQIPFSCWLPAAMSAPTPVSSLVHSSTLVTAGVYLLIRFNFCLFYFNSCLFLLSLLTVVMASFCAVYEYDLKSVIALSTLSQLGLMMTSLLLGFSELSFFHLISHAMFKSLLFLCSGLMIYIMGDNQDLRSMGSLMYFMPFTSCCFNISNFSLCGMPFLTGFYSKDLVIEMMVFSNLNIFLFFIYYLSLSLTVIYSFRLIYYSLLYNYKFMMFTSVLDSSNLYNMYLSIFILSIMSLIFGSLLLWLLNFDLGFMVFPSLLSFSTMFCFFIGLWLGYELIYMKSFFSMNIIMFNGCMWYLYGYMFNVYNLLYKSSYLSLFVLFWGEYYGPLGISYYLLKLVNLFQMYMLTSIKFYFITFLFWLLIMI
uniref:NADH-ubiquinone oxidoreductase chain 5 n=1 Tax=Cicadellidae gen. sp. 1 JCX-2018 TaxID=2306300 RepID=A0A346RNJ3_9HEMI|nr:NADH dehydrogenase subunit 5 [Cicadellidae gen. sp. 1 JCX-2018]